MIHNLQSVLHKKSLLLYKGKKNHREVLPVQIFAGDLSINFFQLLFYNLFLLAVYLLDVLIQRKFGLWLGRLRRLYRNVVLVMLVIIEYDFRDKFLGFFSWLISLLIFSLFRFRFRFSLGPFLLGRFENLLCLRTPALRIAILILAFFINFKHYFTVLQENYLGRN